MCTDLLFSRNQILIPPPRSFQQERQNVEDLQRALALAKQKYKATLKSLETISDGIHEMRKAKASSLLPPRTPGVGAESIYSQSSDTSDLPSINLGQSLLNSTSFAFLIRIKYLDGFRPKLLLLCLWSWPLVL